MEEKEMGRDGQIVLVGRFVTIHDTLEKQNNDFKIKKLILLC